MKTRNLSIGIFGGLFDPPHIGHLIVNEWLLDEFSLDRIIFIPAFNPPHKHMYSPFEHRYRMTEIAIKGNKRFFISGIEKDIKGRSYTYKVIKALKKSDKIYQQAILYLIIGADQWNEIRHWKKPEVIFNETRVIVLPRPNFEIKKIRPYYNKILLSNAPLIDLSSTLLRERIKRGLGIEYLTVPGVVEYIKKNKFYS
uniref:Probable nicotinate-nucleotide adenylyltransferase n=1 Tax=candidate division WOR-3 bacterium TaxID=2052148 RepID=A0A7V0Z7D0_UNCW3